MNDMIYSLDFIYLLLAKINLSTILVRGAMYTSHSQILNDKKQYFCLEYFPIVNSDVSVEESETFFLTSKNIFPYFQKSRWKKKTMNKIPIP